MTHGEFHLSSLLVHAAPTAADAVVAGLEALPGVELHAREPSGRLIVTVETESEAGLAERMAAIRALDDVYAVSLVYHHIENAESMQSEIS